MMKNTFKILSLALLLSSSMLHANTTGYYADNFDAQLYSNQNGDLSWTANWIDSDNNTPTSGRFEILTTGVLEIGNIDTFTLEREFSAAGIISASYAFDVTANELAKGIFSDNDYLQVQCHIGGGNWYSFKAGKISHSNGTGHTSTTMPPSCLIADAKIRFISGSGNWGGNDSYIRIDNLRIDVVAAHEQDTDGDGVLDFPEVGTAPQDVDNDNDGILNVNESFFNSFPIGQDIAEGTPTAITTTQNGQTATITYTATGNGFTKYVAFPGYDGLYRSDHNHDAYLEYAISPQMYDMTFRISDLDGEEIISINYYDAAGNRLGDLTSFITEQVSKNNSWTLSSDATYGMTVQVIGYDTGADSDENYIQFSVSAGISKIAIYCSNNNRGTADFTLYSGYFDTDGDSIPDSRDLDSDNDGIPDNIEGRSSAGLVPIDFTQGVNAEGVPVGIVNTEGPGGIVPVNTDSDSKPDFLDTDSDNDNVSDCEEGIREDVVVSPHQNKTCPITNQMVGLNGMAEWAETADNYTNPAGLVTGVSWGTLDEKLIDLVTGNEVSYREISKCGNATWELKANQWKTIAAPCVINNTIVEIFSGELGTYGDADNNWTMYGQDVTNGPFTGNPDSDYPSELPINHKMNMPGRGYWIISSTDANISIDETALDVSVVPGATPVNHSETHPDFTQVHHYTGSFPTSSEPLKFLAGNPFASQIHVGDIFLSGDSGGNFYPMYDGVNIPPFAKRIVYTYDYEGRHHTYDAKIPAGGTPGFGNVIEEKVGFWMRFEANTGPNIKIDFPLEK